MLSSEVLVSKQEKQKLKEQELEIAYLQKKIRNIDLSKSPNTSNDHLVLINNQSNSHNESLGKNNNSDIITKESHRSKVMPKVQTKIGTSGNIFKRNK